MQMAYPDRLLQETHRQALWRGHSSSARPSPPQGWQVKAAAQQLPAKLATCEARMPANRGCPAVYVSLLLELPSSAAQPAGHGGAAITHMHTHTDTQRHSTCRHAQTQSMHTQAATQGCCCQRLPKHTLQLAAPEGRCCCYQTKPHKLNGRRRAWGLAWAPAWGWAWQRQRSWQRAWVQQRS